MTFFHIFTFIYLQVHHAHRYCKRILDGLYAFLAQAREPLMFGLDAFGVKEIEQHIRFEEGIRAKHEDKVIYFSVKISTINFLQL
jgi:hypothetical protein